MSTKLSDSAVLSLKQAGAEAFAAKVQRKSPYPEGSTQDTRWLQGYNDAMREYFIVLSKGVDKAGIFMGAKLQTYC